MAGLLGRILSKAKAAFSPKPKSWSDVAKRLGIESAKQAADNPGPEPGPAARSRPAPKKRGLLERIFGTPDSNKVSEKREEAWLKRLPPGTRGTGAPPVDPDTGAPLPFAPWQHGTTLPVEDWKAISAEEAQDFIDGLMPLFCQSSNIAMLQYHPAEKILVTEFRNGRSYFYSGISRSDAIGVLRALSKGKWNWEELRGEVQRKAPNVPGLPGLRPYTRIR